MARLPILFAAPHRLAFLTGSFGLGASAAWWLAVLAGLAAGRPLLPEGDIALALLHAPMLLFFGFAPFVFGFLMTVFPRWLGYPDLAPARHGPASVLLALAALVAQAGLWSGERLLLAAGFALLLAGWFTATLVLALVLKLSNADGKPVCWHAWSALGALTLGLVALAATLAFIVTGDGAVWRLGHQLAAGGFLLPVFLTVSHRMIPFFAGNVVKSYSRWRPDWLLGALWLFLLVRLAGELAPHPGLALAGNAALAALTGVMAWKWWPRAAAPGLLVVLTAGFAWAPAGFLLGALASAGVPLGLAPTHALLVGFSGSLLVAMVTRVTQGHSGRALAMFPLAWLAFAAVQAAAAVRITAVLAGEAPWLLALAAAVLAAGMIPWLLRNAAIYLAPRRDGRPG